jgi:hypothetical protein
MIGVKQPGADVEVIDADRAPFMGTAVFGAAAAA